MDIDLVEVVGLIGEWVTEIKSVMNKDEEMRENRRRGMTLKGGATYGRSQGG